ncbi:hypothetical protein POF50_025730 [Streptomyces sp. SL13]|uniref:Uncharacterized protein n=1 Tax=Streptantibioticus silvisoli TaxID=2705255 RepID=A0AA90K041_9ACTN|nr:hypothetical protein [Streptantibioticus silvisoli]MDI5972701.1 hypothetical protein [Streptantibioticus silvisoli]
MTKRSIARLLAGPTAAVLLGLGIATVAASPPVPPAANRSTARR